MRAAARGTSTVPRHLLEKRTSDDGATPAVLEELRKTLEETLEETLERVRALQAHERAAA
jgi:hypothetical protein